jgi:transposase
MPHSISIHIQALTMASLGIDIKIIAANLSLSRQIIQYWVKKAMDRGYNPAVDPRIHLEYVEDGKRSGRPKEITEAIKEGILDSICKDRNGHEKSSEILAYKAGISYSSVLRILKQRGLKAVK